MKWLPSQGIGLIVVLLVMTVGFGLASPHFFSIENITNILIQSAVHTIIALGMTMVMATAGIDLSIGAMLALSSIVTAGLIKTGTGTLTAVLAGIGSGAVMGLINGAGVGWLGMSPFIVTLGTAGIYRALALIITQARPIYGLPMELRRIGIGRIAGIPISVLIALGAAAVVFYVMNWTRFGTNARAVGDNDQGAFRMGVSTAVTRIGIYAASGAAAAIAGLVVIARLNTAEAIAGLGIELEAIAAVVMGGTSFWGGEARVIGSLFGTWLIAVLYNGLTLTNVPSYYQQLVVGLVFISAVIVDRLRRPDKAA